MSSLVVEHSRLLEIDLKELWLAICVKTCFTITITNHSMQIISMQITLPDGWPCLARPLSAFHASTAPGVAVAATTAEPTSGAEPPRWFRGSRRIEWSGTSGSGGRGLVFSTPKGGERVTRRSEMVLGMRCCGHHPPPPPRPSVV